MSYNKEGSIRAHPPHRREKEKKKDLDLCSLKDCEVPCPNEK